MATHTAGGGVTSFVASMGSIVLLGGEVFRSLFTTRLHWNEFIKQLHFVGWKSQVIVLTTGASTGMVFCAQTFFQFHKMKMDNATLTVVGVAMITELGPVLAGLMVAGRVGAAISAELGTMRVTEQIDALRTMATHPVDYLVVPRFLATVIAMPLLTVLVVAMGVLAAYGVGKFLYGMDGAYALKHMKDITGPIDLWLGLVKSLFFGMIISIIGCYRGLNCGLGAEGVGRATNQAVVQSCIIILISNFFLSLVLRKFFILMGWWI